MGNRSAKEVIGQIKIEKGHYLDTFDSFRGKVYWDKDCLVIAIANIGLDGPLFEGRDENWIDKCVLIAKKVIRLNAGIIDPNNIVIGGTSLSGTDIGELEIRAESVNILLLSDSTVFAQNPLIGLREAEEFIRSVDVSNADWLAIW